MATPPKRNPHKVTPQKKEPSGQYKSGRGAQINTANRFLKNSTEKMQVEAIDDWQDADVATEYQEQRVKSMVNKVDSPDLPMAYSMNPYAGCEHGCIYCYARNVHEYWGYSAGLDFERKIIVKTNAPEVLRKFLMQPRYEPTPIMLSGNTDCYQPAEKKYRLTRKLLEVCESFHQPVGIITKNSRILMDQDILERMAKKGLVSVLVTLTSLNEDLRRVMEPRTTTAAQRLKVIESLSQSGVHTGVMMGPVIPGLNDSEMHSIMKEAAAAGAKFSAYTFIRLNGAVKLLFHDWLQKNFPDRAGKVWHLIESSHGGTVSDSRWGVRMRGEGQIADLIHQQFKKYSTHFGLQDDRWQFNTGLFQRPGSQIRLF